MNKYLFLDIHGVVSIPKPNEGKNEWSFDDERQILLGQILAETGAKIIASTSLRCDTVEETKEKLEKSGFWFSEHIVGVTIRAYRHISKEPKIHLSIPRGVEIKQWIDANIHSENGKNINKKILDKDFAYCILDNRTDMLLEQAMHFVRCDSFEGLTEDSTRWVIDVLNGNFLP